MTTLFCWGELLLRLSPALEGQWIKNNNMPVYIGGAELNVAQALASWKQPVSYATALPENYLSKEIVNHIESLHIDTSSIIYSGNRIGTYYLPSGADLKNAGVIYDRAYSSFATLQPGTINWRQMLENKTWFHFSAISPALNEDAATVCEEALKVAEEMGLTISVDLNYRNKLWQYGKAPHTVMSRLLPYCNVVMGNIWAVEKLLGIPSPLQDSVGYSAEELAEAAYLSMQEVRKTFLKNKYFAFTYRLQDEYFAVIDNNVEQAVSMKYSIADVLDRVGSGDCFMGGLIYGLTNNYATQNLIEFATAAAVGKLYEKGDATKQTVQDVEARIASQKKVLL